MPPIAIHLWYDKDAKDAAALYTSLFPDSKITSTTTLHDTPSGDADLVAVELCGQDFRLISAGPYFKFTPAISMLVSCETKDEVDRLWNGLSAGGTVMMPLDAYPFSERFGWVADRYGLSWQLMFTPRPIRQKITPVLMFTGNNAGKAEEAMNFYASLFPRSNVAVQMRYGKGQEPEVEGTVTFATFALDGQEFGAMDSARPHGFTFNEAISFMVRCNDQSEIDEYWERLSADPKAEQCGWLKDKFGVSWQIVPTIMEEMLTTNDPEKMRRVTQAFLKMKKFDIAKLREAYEAS